ncbi:hypothetical protein QAD02_018084 [Eretmocerus hayati]|uniref:Uncharacterized protein n=1 Tax=Eretmocerus hayati TaxID=131215 RepID=A0ACC2PFN9_9HYME|nr:hypothetical protein QAD02_018084 [Eretmocerus hayati]
MSPIQDDQIISVGKVLNDESRPLKERFRALFTLKNIGGSLAIIEIQRAFNDSSALLKHELAYCLGQMQDSHAIPILVDVLKDKSQEPMVRHEAGEALGAIGDASVAPILDEYSRDPVVEVAETSLSKGLKAGSALFRHEIAFVLGQLQNEVSVPFLKSSLEDPNENEMVRHECAEALGAIATPYCFDLLKNYVEDKKRVVRESCVIALDMCEYENSSEFQYANGLSHTLEQSS